MVLFSKRNGLTPIKVDLQIESIDTNLQNGLWNAIYTSWDIFPGGVRRQFFIDFWINYLKKQIDVVPSGNQIGYVKEYYYKCKWFEIYDFIEYFISQIPQANKDIFAKLCNVALEKELSGYRLVDEKIVPITNKTEINEIIESIENSQEKGLAGVENHLKTALTYLSDRENPDFRNSIKESISAVESIAVIISGKPKASLGEALSIIEEKIGIHGALKQGFSNLYGYTSDEHGIRHSMEQEPNLFFEDAKYMLVSCAAFINYLIVKADKAGIKL